MSAGFSYGSVCSGIEAASAAWHVLGWRASWFAEIEPAPSAVLAYRWPDVPNLGDMTQIAKFVRMGLVEAPDVLVGGTPCQAFSIAGLRGGLTDARGQLTLTYVDLANAIDEKRGAGNECVIYWENVPGVLSDSTNAFGCFLGALAGEDSPLECAGGKWPNTGVVVGPQRAIAWRVLDAQYFGVAQRRRRVFVVASARPGFDPAAVLFEFDGVRRDSAPRREAGQDVAGTLASRAGGGGFPGSVSGNLQTVAVVAGTLGANHGNVKAEHAWTGQLVAFGGNRTGGEIDVSPALREQGGWKGDFESETFLVQPCAMAYGFKPSHYTRGKDGAPSGVAPPLSADADKGDQDTLVFAGMAVRRLIPRECERLQGFRDDYTLVPVERRAPGRRIGPPPLMADGPRHKALGNSMCVNVMRWLGMRLMVVHPEYFY